MSMTFLGSRLNQNPNDVINAVLENRRETVGVCVQWGRESTKGTKRVQETTLHK